MIPTIKAHDHLSTATTNTQPSASHHCITLELKQFTQMELYFFTQNRLSVDRASPSGQR